MASDRSIWGHMDPYGLRWALMVRYGAIWSHTGPQKHFYLIGNISDPSD